MRIHKFLLGSLIGCLSFSCTEKSNEQSKLHEGMDSKTKTRMQQYYRQGKKLYTTYCASCHQTDGSGLASLYPPLSGSDFLMNNPVGIVCLIKKGISGEIVVNGKKYNQPMPGFDHLTNIEIAEIITYICNSWDNQSTLYEVKKIEPITKECL